MKAKNILIVLVAAMTLFTEGCSLMDLMGGMGMQPPAGPLGQLPGLPPGQGPLDGSLNGGLPLGPGPVAAAPGATPTAPTAPTSPQTTPVPDPSGTPAGITPPSPVIPAATGGTPQATPVGSGPIQPLAAANPVADTLALTPPVLPPPGLN